MYLREILGITFGNGIFIAVCSDEFIVTSTDGISFGGLFVFLSHMNLKNNCRDRNGIIID
jgi:hypothetical protein